MPAPTEGLIPTEHDMLAATKSQRQMGALKFGWKESVEAQVKGKTVSHQEAAEILKVSRPYAAKLFEEGAIPSRRMGMHRRALTADVLAYKQREKEGRLAVLDELAVEGQKLKVGY